MRTAQKSTKPLTSLFVLLASIASVYTPAVAITLRDARMRDQLAADLHS